MTFSFALRIFLIFKRTKHSEDSIDKKLQSLGAYLHPHLQNNRMNPNVVWWDLSPLEMLARVSIFPCKIKNQDSCALSQTNKKRNSYPTSIRFIGSASFWRFSGLVSSISSIVILLFFNQKKMIIYIIGWQLMAINCFWSIVIFWAKTQEKNTVLFVFKQHSILLVLKRYGCKIITIIPVNVNYNIYYINLFVLQDSSYWIKKMFSM